jgi:uncharacterized protein (TIGR00730 family)
MKKQKNKNWKHNPFPSKANFKKSFSWRIFKIMGEFVEGFELISELESKTATVFGGTRFSSKSSIYKEAEKLGRLLSKEGYTVVTGGGPGIMEAANRGAYEAGGNSVGMNILLPREQLLNKYINRSEDFYYFFIRKIMLSMASSIYIFFPGGYGTLDEFFEMLVLLQTKKLSHQVLIIAIGKKYWQSLLNWFSKELYEKYNTISKEDLNLFKIVDTAEEAVKYIKSLKKVEKK